MSIFTNVSAEDKKMLDRIYWRSFMVFSGGAGAAYGPSVGFANSTAPALNRYLPDPEMRAEVMVSMMPYYNITQNVGTFAMGLAASMYRQFAEHHDEFDVSSIVALRTSLMGPMSGIGDAIFWGIVRCVAAGIGIGFAASGSILGPLLFLLIYNIPGMICRYYMTYLGFTMGANFITKAFESGMVTILTKCAGIIGLMMVGFMIYSNVNMNVALTMTVPGAEPVAVQQYLDDLMIKVLPMGLSWTCYFALKKNINPTTLIMIVMGVGIVLGALGICG